MKSQILVRPNMRRRWMMIYVIYSVTESSGGWKIGGWHGCGTCTVTDFGCGWNPRSVGRGQCYLFCDSYNPGAAEDWEMGMGVVSVL